MHNTCPADKQTKRQEIKELIYELNGRVSGLKAGHLGRCSAFLCRSGGRWSTAGVLCLRSWENFSKFDRRKFPARMETGRLG